ncbi:hypothetical protein DERF_004863 [Dermatophagoides farinae]|uniref:Uncharacterized protein n=1 Tax=Dermatophagoides farinae TaxID=6954 RepID=A0A922I5N7_DERFA|nr:hypothetical protein DERF_004863 [Dermatophagoides farinae]
MAQFFKVSIPPSIEQNVTSSITEEGS